MIGVYAIVNAFNGKRYVGSSFNTKRRWSEHRSDLRLQHHENPKLQNAYNKYGLESFSFEILESFDVIDKKDLILREQYWLDYFQSYDHDLGYNVSRFANSSKGRKVSLETRRKISLSHMGKSTRTGIKHTPEAILKMSLNRCGKPAWNKGKKLSPLIPRNGSGNFVKKPVGLPQFME